MDERILNGKLSLSKAILYNPDNPNTYNQRYLCCCMRIAIDRRFSWTTEYAGYNQLINEIFTHLSRDHREHQFIFFTNEEMPASSVPHENVTNVVLPLKGRNTFLKQLRSGAQVCKALKKYQADVFVGGNNTCSFGTAVPQVFLFAGFAFYSRRVFKIQSFFQKKLTGFSFKKAKAIITFSEFVKEEIVKAYRISSKKVTNAGEFATGKFKPLDWQQREEAKQQYSGGCEYFIYYGGYLPASTIWNVLKAFSIFKKWQKSNMKLVIAGSAVLNDKVFTERLNTYKYRSEIYLIDNPYNEDWPLIIGGAYALISTFIYRQFTLPVIEAMHCEVPIITSSDSNIQSVTGDAALYANSGGPEEIAKQMKLIFKDEQLRNKLVENGKQQAIHFNAANTTAAVWKAIERAVSR